MADLFEDDEWRRRAESAIVSLALSGRPFTAEDVRERAGDPTHPNAMGSRFLAASRRRLIVAVPTVNRAIRSSSHARRLSVWRGWQPEDQ